MIIELPRQIDPEVAEAILSTMDAAQGTANAIATGNVFVNILLGASLKFLWGMINTLQFTVFFTEWKARIPANATIAIQTFRKIALGEFIESEWLTDSIKDMTVGEDEDGN